VLRLDPTVPDALESVSLSTYVDPGTLVEYLEIRYRANPDAIDVTVTLQGGDELGNLTDVSSLFNEVGRVDQPDGSQQVTLRSLAPASTLTEAFYQLSVTE